MAFLANSPRLPCIAEANPSLWHRQSVTFSDKQAAFEPATCLTDDLLSFLG
jgi:hypothetical protein